jgi:hypothetical protein
MPSSSSSSLTLTEPAIKASNETTPLLATIAAGPTAEPTEASPQADQVDDYDEDAPLPKLQIGLLCLCRLVEPVAFFAIFPYINQMIENSGVATEDVGFYSGLIESLFSATQMCVMIFWGKVRDSPQGSIITLLILVGCRPFGTETGSCFLVIWDYGSYGAVWDE